VLRLKGYKIHNRFVATDLRVVSSPFTAGVIKLKRCWFAGSKVSDRNRSYKLPQRNSSKSHISLSRLVNH
jgi:hypothetical protein